MTTKTKNVFPQDSNYVALEQPLKELKAKIDSLGTTSTEESITELKSKFTEIYEIVFPKTK